MNNAPYVVEPELSGPGPRVVRLTDGARRTRSVLVNLFVGLFLGLYWASGVDMAFYRRIASEGGKAAATITSIKLPKEKSSRYRVRYDYWAPGHGIVSDTERIRKRDFGLLSPGAPAVVTYLLTDPEKHVFGAYSSDDAEERQHRWNVGLALVGAFGSLAFLCYAAELAGQRRLLAQGVAVPAVVVGRSSADDGMHGRSYLVTYRYPAAGGEAFTTKRAVCASTYERLPEGATFTVLRDPHAPESSTPYFALSGVEVPGAAGPRLPA